MAVAATSRAVSVAAQKNGGLSLQPICRALGMTISGGSSGVFGGSTYAKLCASAAFTIMRQYPSFRSTLEKRNGMPVSGARASVCIIRGMTFPSSYIECCGASVLSEAVLTACMGFPSTVSANARSRIILNFRDLCGIAAMGLIFKFGGGSFRSDSHVTTLQHPSFTRSSASDRQACAASGVFALGWAPRLTAACISVRVQFLPQSTGQPCCA